MARKINNGGSYKMYTGPVVVQALVANYSNETYLKITGRNLPFELNYEEREGKFPVRVLFKIAKTNKENLAVGEFVSGTFYISKTVKETKDGGKKLYVNKKGEYAFLSDPENIPSNMEWFDTTGLREAYDGEKDLATFLRRIIGFDPKTDDFSVINDAILDVVKKRSVKKVNALLNKVPEGLELTNGECGITTLLTVKVDADTGKRTQNIQLREEFIFSTSINKDMEISFGYKAVDNIKKALEKKKEDGYDLSDVYSLEFKELSDEVEKVTEDESELPF